MNKLDLMADEDLSREAARLQTLIRECRAGISAHGMMAKIAVMKPARISLGSLKERDDLAGVEGYAAIVMTDAAERLLQIAEQKIAKVARRIKAAALPVEEPLPVDGERVDLRLAGAVFNSFSSRPEIKRHGDAVIAECRRLRQEIDRLRPEGEEQGPRPVAMVLHCPECRMRHIDVGKFATKPHHTHACQGCGFCWRPSIVPTVGVQFLPGFKNDPDIHAILGYQVADEVCVRAVAVQPPETRDLVAAAKRAVGSWDLWELSNGQPEARDNREAHRASMRSLRRALASRPLEEGKAPTSEPPCLICGEKMAGAGYSWSCANPLCSMFKRAATVTQAPKAEEGKAVDRG